MRKILLWSLPISLVCVLLWSHGIARLYDKPNIQVVEKIVHQKPDFPLERVAGWIFDHSKKTSRKSCLELAALVKPYKHWVLILSIVQAESEFVPSAVSSKLAQGLGQVSFSAHGKDLIAKGIIKEQRDLFDPEMNIRAANHIIEMYMKQHGGDVIKALSAYVGAPEQHKYLAQVLTNYIRLSLALV